MYHNPVSQCNLYHNLEELGLLRGIMLGGGVCPQPAPFSPPTWSCTLPKLASLLLGKDRLMGTGGVERRLCLALFVDHPSPSRFGIGPCREVKSQQYGLNMFKIVLNKECGLSVNIKM